MKRNGKVNFNFFYCYEQWKRSTFCGSEMRVVSLCENIKLSMHYHYNNVKFKTIPISNAKQPNTFLLHSPYSHCCWICLMCSVYSYLNINFSTFFYFHLIFFSHFVLFVEPFKCTSFPQNRNWKADLNFNHAEVIDNCRCYRRRCRRWHRSPNAEALCEYKDKFASFLRSQIARLSRMINSSRCKPFAMK